MKTVLVDAKYYGYYFQHARRHMHIRCADCARMFGVSHSDMVKIENGKILMPEKVVSKIMYNGIAMVLCKNHK